MGARVIELVAQDRARWALAGDQLFIDLDLSTGNLRRCPGAAAPAPADGSAPFVDDGLLAAPDCDPGQVPQR